MTYKRWFDKDLEVIQTLTAEELPIYSKLYEEYSEQRKNVTDYYKNNPSYNDDYNKYLAISHIIKARKTAYKPAPDLTIPEFIDKVNTIKNYKSPSVVKKTIFNSFKEKLQHIQNLFKFPNIHLSPIELMPCYNIIYKLPFGIYFLSLKDEYRGPSNCTYVVGKTYRFSKEVGRHIIYYHQVKIVELF